MTNTIFKTIRSEFARFNISYRRLSCVSSEIYFCRIPTGMTFNLKCESDGTIKLWRFVGSVPLSKAGIRYEYPLPNDSQVVLGLEVTSDGDISFYEEGKICSDGAERESQIRRMIENYIVLICSKNFKRAVI